MYISLNIINLDKNNSYLIGDMIICCIDRKEKNCFLLTHRDAHLLLWYVLSLPLHNFISTNQNKFIKEEKQVFKIFYWVTHLQAVFIMDIIKLPHSNFSTSISCIVFFSYLMNSSFITSAPNFVDKRGSNIALMCLAINL